MLGSRLTTRDALLLLHGVGWLVALIVSAIQTKRVPDTLWPILPAGIGGILVAYRAEPSPGPGDQAPPTATGTPAPEESAS